MNANKMLSRHRIKLHNVRNRTLYLRASELSTEDDPVETVGETSNDKEPTGLLEQAKEKMIVTDSDEDLTVILNFLHDELGSVQDFSGTSDAGVLEWNAAEFNDSFGGGEESPKSNNLIPLDGSVDYWNWSVSEAELDERCMEQERVVASNGYTEDEVADAIKFTRSCMLMENSEVTLSILRRRFISLPVVVLKGIIKSLDFPENRPVEIVKPLAPVVEISDDEEDSFDEDAIQDVLEDSDEGETDVSLYEDSVYGDLVNIGLLEE